MTVVTTAPTYLFWRCAQPDCASRASSSTRWTGAVAGRWPWPARLGHAAHRPAQAGRLRRRAGECEEVVARLADAPDLAAAPSIAYWRGGAIAVNGGPAAASFTRAPALRWPDAWIERHTHHHHRFDATPTGPGAEVEASRGCPYACTFCAKIDFRDAYRRRDLDLVLAEVDGLIAQGVEYVYFIDEIFLPQRPLLEALAQRRILFGVQTRIDLWKPEMLDLLGVAGCVSIEAGVESLTPEGRAALDKKCRSTTEDLAERLIHARRTVPFVQANLIKTVGDDAGMIAAWRERLQRSGVWANDPVPLYPYPSSPDYRKLWGAPDELAWERAHAHYLAQFDSFSEIQHERPMPLPELEAACGRP
jgi:B12-binding domain/radical SAM domain protein of rhizo-twelve system